MSFYSCIKSLIKRGKTTLPGNDAGVIPTAQVNYMGKVSVCDIINPAGFSHNPIAGNLVVLLNVSGTEDNLSGIVTSQLGRIKNLQPGETVIYNTVTKSYIILKNDASIEMFASDININANVNITGDLNVGGKTSLGSLGSPIAREGDDIQVTTGSGTYVGQIISGSSNNSAN